MCPKQIRIHIRKIGEVFVVFVCSHRMKQTNKKCQTRIYFSSLILNCKEQVAEANGQGCQVFAKFPSAHKDLTLSQNVWTHEKEDFLHLSHLRGNKLTVVYMSDLQYKSSIYEQICRTCNPAHRTLRKSKMPYTQSCMAIQIK